MIPFLMTRHITERTDLENLTAEEISQVTGGSTQKELTDDTMCTTSTITPNGDGSCCTQDADD